MAGTLVLKGVSPAGRTNPAGNVYVLAVNKNPVESKRIRMLPGADDGIEHEWTTLAPGEGRLFKILQDDPPIPQPTGA